MKDNQNGSEIEKDKVTACPKATNHAKYDTLEMRWIK